MGEENNGSAMTRLPDNCNEFTLIARHLSHEFPKDTQRCPPPLISFVENEWEQIPAS